MKKFLKKRWRGLPIGIISVVLAMCLLAGGVYAACSFLTFTTEITLDEPLTVELNWWDYNENEWIGWWELTGEQGTDELDLYMSPGETQTFGVRIFNRSYSPLTVSTLISGEVGYFTFDGFPNGVIPGSDGNDSTPEWVTLAATITADGAAPSQTYSVTFTFTRE